MRRRSLSFPVRLLLLSAPAGLAALFAFPGPVLAQGFGGTVADHLVRGDSYLGQNRNAEAIMQFQEARTLCPTPAEIVHSLHGEAQAHIGQGEMLQAAGLLEEAATRFPDDPRVADILYLAGMARQKAGESEKAADLFRQALAHTPTRDVEPLLRFQMARTLRLRGKPAEAIEVIKDFDTSFPDHPLTPNVLYTIAIARHDLKQLDQAETLYRTIIEKFKGSPAALEAHFDLAGILAAQHKWREAVDLYTRYAGLSPSSPFAAKAMERAGDLLLLRSPTRSLELYGLAQVKAGSNPPAPTPELQLSGWIETKKRIARALSSVWIPVLAGIVALAAAVLVGRWVLRRRRTARPVSA